MAVIELERPGVVDKGEIVANRLVRVFEVFERYGLDARLVGSLGRAASIGRDPSSLDSCRTDRGIKDIDIVCLSGSREEIDEAVQAATTVAYPCRMDETFKDLVSIGQEGAFLRHRNISVPVDPRVFEKREGHILGVTVPTLNPRTLVHLTEISGGINHKMFRNLHAFLGLIKDRKDLLPEEMFEPFHRVRDLEKEYYPRELRINKIRGCYQDHVSKDVRAVFLPITRPLRIFLQNHS